MRFVRYNTPAGARWGQLEDGQVHELDNAPYSGGRQTGQVRPADGLKLLAPVDPSKLICIGRNYAEHAAELGNQAPTEPMFFLKAPSSLIGPGEAVVVHHPEHATHWEAELAVVIGKRGHRSSRSRRWSMFLATPSPTMCRTGTTRRPTPRSVSGAASRWTPTAHAGPSS